MWHLGNILNMASLSLLVSCGEMSFLVPTDGNEKKPSHPSSEAPQPTPGPGSANQLNIARKVRRITIELTGEFPNPRTVESILQKPESLVHWSEHLLQRQAAYTIISQYFQQIWNLNRSIPFDLFKINREDHVSQNVLSNKFIDRLRQEPFNILDENFLLNSPFRNVLTLNYSILNENIVAKFDVVSEKKTEFSPHVFFSYNDTRPKSTGILFTNGWLAAFPTFGSPHQLNRSYSIRKTLFCDNMESPYDHLFLDLSHDELDSDLVDLSLVKSTCSNCHVPLQETASLYQGMGQGKSWKEWHIKTITDPTIDANLTIKGSEFAKKTANDSRFIRCQIERLTSLIFQTPYVSNFHKTTALELETLKKEQDNLRQSLRWLFTSDYFFYPPTKSPKTKGNGANPPGKAAEKDSLGKNKAPELRKPTDQLDQRYLENQKREIFTEISGLRVLRRDLWQRLLTHLFPVASTLHYPEELNPGFREDSEFDESPTLPLYPYWSAIETLAQEFAQLVVRQELGHEDNPFGVKALDRYLFNLLPDDAIQAKKDDVVKQIVFLWYRFTSEKIDEKSEFILEIFQLWNEIKSQRENLPESEESMIEAWRAVIFVMLTHPMFFTY